MRYHVVPASYLFLLRPAPDGSGDEVLLQLRQNTGFRDGFWAAAAAGHVEAGESAPAAVLREAREEIGIDVDAADVEPLTAVHRTGNTGKEIDERVDFFFACRRWTGEPTRAEPDKSADLRWFALDALPDPVVPHELAVLDQLRSGTMPAIGTHGFGGSYESGANLPG